MRAVTKLAAFAACAFLVQSNAALAEPSSQVSSGEIQKALDTCPKGMVEGPDGVCVRAKSGRMGFDLAAPSDSAGDSAQTAPSAARGTRSVAAAEATRRDTEEKGVDLRLSFDVGSADLNDQDKANAHALAAMLMLPKYAPVKVLIAGHTDRSGSAAYNMGLSKKRADSVKAYLVSQGIDASRLQTVGYGFTRLAKRVVVARRIE
jgi:outer membrane protein OmpA-like peptidoglycan-associated protein